MKIDNFIPLVGFAAVIILGYHEGEIPFSIVLSCATAVGVALKVWDYLDNKKIMPQAKVEDEERKKVRVIGKARNQEPVQEPVQERDDKKGISRFSCQPLCRRPKKGLTVE